MPHVQVIGPCTPQQVGAAVGRLVEAHPPLVLKIEDGYLSGDGRRLLLESLVVEGHLRQGFFLLVRQDEEGVLIRCHPWAPVQRTDGVKRLIALVARKCLEACPGSRIGNTNLDTYLVEPPAEPGRA